MEKNLVQNNYGQAQNQVACAHCGELCPTTPIKSEGKPFCCYGCKSVFFILKNSGLENYYNIRKSFSGNLKLVDNKPQEVLKGQFDYILDSEFLSDHSRSFNDFLLMDFFLENIQCPACLWLIENLPIIDKDVLSSKLNFSKSVVTIKVNKDSPEHLKRAAELLNSLGYKPHPLSNNTDIEGFKKNEDRSMLIKMGVAASCAMNLMLYSVSIYSGADAAWKESFSYISFALILPVIFYSALPFYQSSLRAIKTKQINIDVPIAIAIIIGFLGSCTLMFMGSKDLYFDSLATLVFLLLISRYALLKAQKKALDGSQLSSFFQQNQAHIYDKSSERFVDKHAKYIKTGDILLIKPNETILADGNITKGESYINLATFNGEPEPQAMSIGSHVLAGTKNLTTEIEIEVTATQEETRLGKILIEVQENIGKRTYLSELSRRFSTFFVSAVLFISFSSFLFFTVQFGFHEALSRVLSLIIISCPCAFALATPLAYTKSLSLAAQRGIFIKNETLFEKILNIKNVFFDKTGTLTNGKFEVQSWINLKDSSNGLHPFQILEELERDSTHPIAVGLKKYIQSQKFERKTIQHREVKEIISKGVEGFINHEFYSLKRQDDHSQKSFVLYHDLEALAEIVIDDQKKDGVDDVLTFLQKRNLSLNLLSGDIKKSVEHFLTLMPTPFNQVFSHQSPKSKAEIIQSFPHSLFVGDGVNDALSMAKSDVSVAVKGSADVSLRVADVYLTTQSLTSLTELFILSEQTKKVVIRNLVISCIYNTAGIVLALYGYISPLTAAIVMPISSLSVILLTLIGTKPLRKLKGGLL